MASFRDRARATSGTPVLAACRVHCGARVIAGHLLELGERGARVICEARPPDALAEVVIEVRLRPGPATRLPGQVTWSHADHQPSFGVSFRGMSDAEERQVHAAVARLAQAARPR